MASVTQNIQADFATSDVAPLGPLSRRNFRCFPDRAHCFWKRTCSASIVRPAQPESVSIFRANFIRRVAAEDVVSEVFLAL